MLAIYIAVAIAVGVAAFAVTDGLGRGHGPASDRPGLVAVIAGLCWPVLAVGFFQCVVIAAVMKLAAAQRRRTPASHVLPAKTG